MQDAVSLADEIANLVIQKLKSQAIMPRVWFTHSEAAEYLRISVRHLEAVCKDGNGPKPRRAGGNKRLYHIQDLNAFVEGQS